MAKRKKGIYLQANVLSTITNSKGGNKSPLDEYINKMYKGYDSTFQRNKF